MTHNNFYKSSLTALVLSALSNASQFELGKSRLRRVTYKETLPMFRNPFILRFIICGFAVGLTAIVPTVHAGMIDLTAGAVIVTGPGLGNVALPVAITTNLNNDNQDGSTPLNDNNIIVPIKRFDASGYIDIVFPVSDTDGVSEYVVFENVDNNSGEDWIGFTMELGFGMGASFVRSVPGDGLDFDAPDYSPTADFFSTAFANIALGEDLLVFSGGVQSTGSQNYGFRIDVPDDTEGFTIRQTPTAVPIPAAAWLFGSGLLGLVGVARRKKA